ncbi:hypothetical protein KSP40_PGU018969 [Platanthera guangdongensis]|uniref:Uncharacterized protein n=1 Tax=Platanthera guangdongensis TaxID=2320717 RepID=A0ABR2M605_9ASPA
MNVSDDACARGVVWRACGPTHANGPAHVNGWGISVRRSARPCGNRPGAGYKPAHVPFGGARSHAVPGRRLLSDGRVTPARITLRRVHPLIRANFSNSRVTSRWISSTTDLHNPEAAAAAVPEPEFRPRTAVGGARIELQNPDDSVEENYFWLIPRRSGE